MSYKLASIFQEELIINVCSFFLLTAHKNSIDEVKTKITISMKAINLPAEYQIMSARLL